ncbi:MAG: superoxide dismutase [Bacteroidia bacterium]|nr:superoxide dismutase [Bacteroidia bacterium]
MENNRRNFIKTAAVLGLTGMSNPMDLFAANPELSQKSDIKPVNGKYELPALGYAYQALEPHIDAKTMEIHHTKHHQAYINKLNEALEKEPQLKSMPLETMLRDLRALPDSVRSVVRNHGGGHWNHSFFWTLLKTGTKPSPALTNMLTNSFGTVDNFKKEFEKAGTGLFGSGWVWVINQMGTLKIVTTPNQDNPLMDLAEVKGKPVMGCDVWEHAYYLKYQNKRADYLTAFWNVLNWDQVEANTR